MAPTSGSDRTVRADHDVALDDHCCAEGVDRDRPAGAALSFDGDGTTCAEQPEGRFAARTAHPGDPRGRGADLGL